MQLNELKSEISKIETMIKTDSQIILLRDKVVQSSDSQMRNGVITTSEYVTELNQLFDAKTNQKVHQTQLELANLAGVGKTTVFDIEKNKETVRWNTLLAILKVLNIEVQFKSPIRK